MTLITSLLINSLNKIQTKANHSNIIVLNYQNFWLLTTTCTYQSSVLTEARYLPKLGTYRSLVLTEVR